MASHLRLQGIAAATFALGSLLIAGALPASAETVLSSCSGTCGAWQVHDDSSSQDAVCVYYDKRPGELKEMTVKPPTVYGSKSTKTQVGWRFMVQDKGFTAPANWKTIYTSPWQTASANKTSPASSGHGFAQGVWPTGFGPKGPGSIFEGYRVLVDIEWWHSGSVSGAVEIKYDWYKEARVTRTGSSVDDGNCKGSHSD